MVLLTSWFYIIFSYLTLIVNYALVIALFNNFIKKKTAGTIILFTAYLIVTLATTFGAITYTLEILPIRLEVIGVLFSISTVGSQFGLLLIYVFSTRHILKDGDVLKNLTISIFSAFLGFILTIYLLGVFNVTEQFPNFTPPTKEIYWWQLIRTNIPNSDLYNIAGYMGLSIGIIFIEIYINIRIAIKAFVLAKKTDKMIRIRGLQMIAWGLLLMLIGGIIIGLEVGMPWPSNSNMPTLFWALRKITFLIAYFLLYIGWIMPDWFRKRIREKTWFEMRYKEVDKFSQ